MKRFLAVAALAAALFAVPAFGQSTNVNSSAYPLSSNIMFAFL